ncbi:MAG: SpoIIE family protein phosphatase [Flavobacteriales bacterium]|nr:SpoIIE family protein phosphatase [Flavobacteriales bacterium]MCB9168560.1 SpoIIE family protein phosphatase [Flavobacteriales bacterium]
MSWKAEARRVAMRYHVTGSWFAAVVNPIFFLNDRLVLPHLAIRFLMLRLLVSAGIIATLLLRRRLRTGPEQVVLVPFLLISIENAYMWSYMDPVLFRMHSLAYAVLFVGASMIVLWPWRYSLFVIVMSLLANAWALADHSPLAVEEVMANGGTLLATVALISALLIHTRYRQTLREIALRMRLKESNAHVLQQKAIIEENHRDLTSSIEYSHRIQRAVLSDAAALRDHFPESFLFQRAKDIVSGDLLWCRERDGCVHLAVVDCTGHGVPGALMSMLAHALLNKVVVDEGVRGPANILDRLRDEVITTLRQRDGEGTRDGMDIALCSIDPVARTLTYAGAFNPIYLVRDGQLIECPADRMPIGLHGTEELTAFNGGRIDHRAGDMLYLFSDGFIDQFGGPQDKKFGRARFKRTLASIASLPAPQQRVRLLGALELWSKGGAPVDDILIAGVRL